MPTASSLPSPERKITYRFADLALVFLGVITVFAKAYGQSLKAIDSSIYAGLSMTITGQGLIPHLPTGLEIHGGIYGTRGFNDHPGLLLYVAGWVMRALGPEAWTARLVPCLLSAGSVPVLYAIGKRLDDRLRAWLAAAIFALSPIYFRNAAGFQLDGPMTFFILLSFLAWMKHQPARTGLFAGLAILVKAPVGLLIFPTALVAEYVFSRREGRPFLRGSPFLKEGFLALALCLGMVVAFWAACAAIGGSELVSDYWGRYVFGTLQGRDGSQVYDPLLFFRALLHRYWPWLPFLAIGVYEIFRDREWKSRSELIPLAATVISVFVVSLIRFKSGAHYFMPSYPFLAWIAAKPIARWLRGRELGFLQGASTFIFVAVLVLVCFPIRLNPEAYPALRKFNALIQSEGTWRDRVLYVNGDFPYGSFMDYIPEVNFYTGRQVDVRDCAEASATIAGDPRIRWVLVAGRNYQSCFDPKMRALFPTVYRSGDVYLMSKRERAAEIDLTPLERELKAATDGNPAPLPRDIYH